MVVGSKYYCNFNLATVTFFVSDYIFDVIIFGPTNANFVTYRFFCLSNQLGFMSICVTDMPFIIHQYGGKLMF
jgi:sec-independent protein translocase protein TatC